MSKYNGTYSCGHEGRIDVCGPTKNRQWIADRKFEGLCPECYEKQLQEEREKANKIAEEKAKEMELPELIGTEKQVAWANTLRQQAIDMFEKITEMEWNEGLYAKKYSYETLKEIENIIIAKDSAKYFIDNRGNTIWDYIGEEKNNIITKEKIIEQKSMTEIKAESTVKPQNAVSEATAEIIVADNNIKVKFEKNEKFIEIVKSLGYKWSGVWEREIEETTGSSADRAAELGNKLLNAGFPICILDKDIREKAVKGEYEAECKRWIYNIRGKDCLAIGWQERDENLYRVARSLPGSRWNNPYVLVTINHCKEIQEFANMYGFKFTKKAIEAIEDYKKAAEKIETVTPVAVIKGKPKDGLQEILKSNADVLDDLRED